MSNMQKTTPAESSENDMVHVSEGYAPSRATCDTCSHMCVSIYIYIYIYYYYILID